MFYILDTSLQFNSTLFATDLKRHEIFCDYNFTSFATIFNW